MRKSSMRIAGVLSLMLISSCASVPVSAPLLPSEGPAPGMYPAAVSVGDVLQVSYFVNNADEKDLYRVGVGDVLRVDILDHPELAREEAVVTPDGNISINLAGPVRVAGRTLEETGAEITRLFAAAMIRNPKATVSIVRGQQRLRQFMQSIGMDRGMNRLEFRIYDEQPLDLPLVPPASIVGRRISDIRRDIRESYRKEFGSQLEVTVNIGSRPQPSIYVIGEVKKPGSLEMMRSMNLVSAIATAGGAADTAYGGEVLLVRFKTDGRYEYWNFKLETGMFADLRSGGIALQAGDVVYVSKSAIAKIDLFVEQYIRGVLPVNLGVGAYYPLGGK